jgi:hypothetical protein
MWDHLRVNPSLVLLHRRGCRKVSFTMRFLKSAVLRVAVVVSATLAVTCSPAVAQTEGRFSIGPQVSEHIPVGNELDNSVSFGISYSLTRPSSHSKWGPDFGFGWFSADLIGPLDGRVTVRPLLGGYGYTMVQGKFRTHVAALTGPAFVKVKVNDAERAVWAASLGIPVDGVDVKNSWVVKPGVRVVYSIRPRIGIFGSADYEFARLTMQVRTGAQTTERKVKADLVNLKVGVRFGVF